MDINTLWNSHNERDWRDALQHYWLLIKPDHMEIEKRFNNLDPEQVKAMNPEEWYNFLLKGYFFWKYTAPNRYASTTKFLKKYPTTPGGLEQLYQVKQRIFECDKEKIDQALITICSINGLGPAGGSGLLAVLFPSSFATVDQFVTKSLKSIDGLQEKNLVSKMKPESLTIKDAAILIKIMKQKAAKLNQLFNTDFWTPRKIDMILWAYRDDAKKDCK